MSMALNNVTTADAYGAVTTLFAGASTRCNIDVSNAAIYVQFGVGGAGISWSPELFMTPSWRSLERRFDAVRVRSAVAGVPAQVTIEAINDGDFGG